MPGLFCLNERIGQIPTSESILQPRPDPGSSTPTGLGVENHADVFETAQQEHFLLRFPDRRLAEKDSAKTPLFAAPL